MQRPAFVSLVRRALALRRAPIATRSFSSSNLVPLFDVQRVSDIDVGRPEQHLEKLSSCAEAPPPPQQQPSRSILEDKNNILHRMMTNLSEMTVDEIASARAQFSIFDESKQQQRTFSDDKERTQYLNLHCTQWLYEVAIELELLASSRHTPALESLTQWTKLSGFCRSTATRIMRFSSSTTMEDTFSQSDFVIFWLIDVIVQPSVRNEYIFGQYAFWHALFRNYFAVLDRILLLNADYANIALPRVSVLFQAVGAARGSSFWNFWATKAFQALLDLLVLQPQPSSFSLHKTRNSLTISEKMKLCCMILESVLIHEKVQTAPFKHKFLLPVVRAYNQFVEKEVVPLLSMDTELSKHAIQELAHGMNIAYGILLRRVQDDVVPFAQRWQWLVSKLRLLKQLQIKDLLQEIFLRTLIIELHNSNQHDKVQLVISDIMTLDLSQQSQRLVIALIPTFSEKEKHYNSLSMELQQHGLIIFKMIQEAYVNHESRWGIRKLAQVLRECAQRGSYRWPTCFAHTTASLKGFEKSIQNYKNMAYQRSAKWQQILAEEGISAEEYMRGLDALLAEEKSRDDVQRTVTVPRKIE